MSDAHLRPPKIHELKCWPSQWRAIVSGLKKHEVRVFDRDYLVGDILHLRAWSPETETYLGAKLHARVTHITDPGTFGLPADVGVMSIDVINVHGHL